MWALKSPAFDADTAIPKRFTGDGDDVSPALSWSEPPAGTRELALVVDDPDAPSREPWVHWVLYKIPSKLRALPEAVPTAPKVSEPAGLLQGKNAWGSIGWRGPSPPRGHGVHHYHFVLYALDTTLPDKAGFDASQLRSAMRGHVLGEARLTGTYER